MKFSSYISFFTIYLMPFYLITGPFMSDLSLVLVSIYGLYFLIKESSFILHFKNLLILILLIFSIYSIFNSFFFSKIELSKSSGTLFFFRYIFFIIGFYYIAKYEKNFLKKFLISIFFFSIIVSIDLFIQYFFGQNLLGYQMNSALNGSRYSGFFNDELIAGSFLSRLIPYVIILYFLYSLNFKSIFSKIFLIFGLILIFGGVLLSGERTATFYSLIFIFFFILLLSKEKKIRKILFFLICTVLLTFFFTNSDMKKRIVNTTIDSFNIKSNINSFILFSPVHHAHYTTAWNIFLDSKLLGSGSKSFRYLCDDPKYIKYISYEVTNADGITYLEEINGCSTHPHNLLLEILSENGIFGFIIFYSLYILVLIKFIKNLLIFFKTNQYDMLLIINLLCCILFLVQTFPFIPSGSFNNNWLFVFNILPLAFIYIADKKSY